MGGSCRGSRCSVRDRECQGALQEEGSWWGSRCARQCHSEGHLKNIVHLDLEQVQCLRVLGSGASEAYEGVEAFEAIIDRAVVLD